MKLRKDLITKDSTKRLYGLQKPLIGLTGGIGSGKSSVAKLFMDAGITVIDADELVHDIYESDESINFVKGLAPNAVTAGDIDFQKLREAAFSNPILLEDLEKFVYAKIPDFFCKQANTAKSEFIVYDVPLLYEKNIAKYCDFTICVYTTVEMQIRRTMERDHTPKNIVEQIIAKQIPLSEKAQKSDYQLNNIGTLENLEKEFLALLKNICN